MIDYITILFARYPRLKTQYRGIVEFGPVGLRQKEHMSCTNSREHASGALYNLRRFLIVD